MKQRFGQLPDGREVSLYAIQGGGIQAQIMDYGAGIYRLLVPDKDGNVADVVLGYPDPNDYTPNTTYFGSTVGRNANRVCNATFSMNGKRVHLDANDGGTHTLHGGFDPFKNRLWAVEYHEENSIRLRLDSPDGDQGFPGNAVIRVTYSLDGNHTLHIVYDAVSDKDTVFNMTNHSFFNMAGHDHPERAMEQLLSMPARFFNPADADRIPTGELRSVAGTPMDFRKPKPIGQDLNADYESLRLQGGYDHNFEVFTSPCAILSDPVSGRTMAVSTDCCGIQFYSGNFLVDEKGKDGMRYPYRGGICLEPQFYPDAVNHPEWPQPFFKAGERYHSESQYHFSW